MRFPLNFILLLTMLLSLTATSSYAAFPAKTQDETFIAKEHKSLKQELKQTVLQYKNTAPKATRVGGGAADAFGIVSLICGVLGAIFLIVGGAAGILFVPLAVAALVFGILGLKGSHQGMAIAGLILGAVEILILLVAIIFVAAFLGSL